MAYLFLFRCRIEEKHSGEGGVGVVPIEEMSRGAPHLMRGTRLVLVDIADGMTIPVIMKEGVMTVLVGIARGTMINRVEAIQDITVNVRTDPQSDVLVM